MSLRTYVGFVADFPADRGEDDSPAGKELADFVATRLRDDGIDVEGPEEREGWAWDLTATSNGTRIDTIVGLVDDWTSTPPRQWLITNEPTAGFWSRIFGSKTRVDERHQTLRHYCEALHAALIGDRRFSHILWYNKDTFDEPGDEPAASP
jgi:hypothetical protein